MSGCEHDWRTVSVSATADGALVEYVCAWCGALSFLGPDEIAGRAG